MQLVQTRPRITAPFTRALIDENTGRDVRQLTNLEHGAHLGYFRMYRQLPDGRMLAWARHEHGTVILIDLHASEIELLPHAFGSLKFRESDGRNWFIRYAGERRPGVPPSGRELWHIDLPDGEPVHVATIPDDVPGVIEDITADGQHLILREAHEDLVRYPIPTTKDVGSVNHFFSRPRRGAIHVHHIDSGQTTCILRTEGHCPLHLDTSPTDPQLLRYCLDMPESRSQRIWSIRIDGSDCHPIRRQLRGEMITHEFWWSDPNYIGYTYQDRRQDPTVLTHHWAEYAQASTRLGIADVDGEERYLSDPLNCYHTHLYRSPDGTLVCGEGTHDQSFVHVAAFDTKTTRLDMVPLATIHTPYVPFRGQGVDCNFSADSKWLIYADKLDPDKPHQLFAVKVD